MQYLITSIIYVSYSSGAACIRMLSFLCTHGVAMNDTRELDELSIRCDELLDINRHQLCMINSKTNTNKRLRRENNMLVDILVYFDCDIDVYLAHRKGTRLKNPCINNHYCKDCGEVSCECFEEGVE